MNQLYRALHMPPGRLLKKLSGHKEIYTIAVRPRPAVEGATPLPALGGKPYTPLPEVPGYWYADPMLYHRDGHRWLFCEAFDLATGKGSIAAWEFDGPQPHTPHIVLEEPYHLSFPTIFDWNGETWMIPETSANHSFNLYRCTACPGGWEKVLELDVGRELCDTIVLDANENTLALLCSETDPENQLLVRYRRYLLRVDAAGFTLDEDEPYNLQHRAFDYVSRNAGPLFRQDRQLVHATQVSTKVDYGVYLQFYVLRAASEVPLCAATPQNVVIDGIDPKDIVGIHSYVRDGEVEIIDARYLKKLPHIPAAQHHGAAADSTGDGEIPEGVADPPTEPAVPVPAAPQDEPTEESAVWDDLMDSVREQRKITALPTGNTDDKQEGSC